LIESMEVCGLRGIRHLSSVSFSELTVLVGPNGSGKSTVLDGILIGAGSRPGDAIGRAVRRRGGPPGGARWLVGGTDEPRAATIAMRATGISAPWTRLEFWPVPTANYLLDQVAGPPPATQIRASVAQSDDRNSVELYADVVFAHDNQFAWSHLGTDGAPTRHSVPVHFQRPYLRLIDARSRDMQTSDAELNKAAVTAGKRDEVVDWIKPMIRGLKNIELIDNDVLGLILQDGAVPLAVAGDGIAAAVRIGLQLAIPKEGVVLLEEPEAFLHPRAIRFVAKVIWRAIQGGVQCILTTHSIELIDGILDAAVKDPLERLSIVRTRLVNGKLDAVKLEGNDVRAARQDLHEDLL
jgi:energy-coupling factor transporter ATP-binding protein EcfA2